MKPFPVRSCLKCGQEYIPTSANQKYCLDCMFPVRDERRARQWKAAHPRKEHKPKNCQLCGKEYLPTGWTQKFCLECGRVIGIARSTTWAKANPEKAKANNTKYCKANSVKRGIASRGWERKNPERVSLNIARWRAENPEKMRAFNRKHKAKRLRNLGFVPLNSPFYGCEAHHINKDDVIYIPKAMHLSVRHNLETGKNMDVINALAGQYLTEDWT